MQLLQGGSTSLESINKAIEREALWLAALFGIEHLLIGGSSRGSQSLSRDKSMNFALQCDSTLSEIVRTTEVDLFRPIADLNGIDHELIPSVQVEKIQWRDIEQVTTALQQVAMAGAPLTPDDPAVPAVRDLLGLPAPDMTKARVDAGLNRMSNLRPGRSGAPSPAGAPIATVTPAPPKSREAVQANQGTNGTAR